MNMYGPFSEQRARGLQGRNDRYHTPSWFGRRVTRRLSPYVTWLFLRLGISANQCSVLRLALVCAIGPLFVLPHPGWWILAVFARYITIVLDCVDGELARLRGTASAEGTYVDEFTGLASGRITVAFIVFGLYRMLGEHALVIGLVAVVAMSLCMGHIPLLRSVAFEWGLQAPSWNSGRNPEPAGILRARRAAMLLLVAPGVQYLPHLLVASVLDVLVGPFALLGFDFNVRLLWLSLFGAGLAAAGILRAYLTVRRGIAAQL